MCGQWARLLGDERDRAKMLRRAHEILTIQKPEKFGEGRRLGNKFSRSRKEKRAKRETEETVEDKLKHVMFCFQQMETEALVGEKLHQKKLEREIKIQIRERIGYVRIQNQTKQKQGMLLTNSVYKINKRKNPFQREYLTAKRINKAVKNLRRRSLAKEDRFHRRRLLSKSFKQLVKITRNAV